VAGPNTEHIGAYRLCHSANRCRRRAKRVLSNQRHQRHGRLVRSLATWTHQARHWGP